MIKNRFLRNTSWLMFGQMARMVVSFLVSIFTARYLGTANVGTINYVASYISFFTALIGLGLNGVIVYEFVNDSKHEGKILGTAIFLRFIVGIIAVPAFLLVLFTFDGNDSTIMNVAFMQALQLPFLCLDTVNYWYQYKSQSKYAVIVQTAAYLFTAAYKVFLILTDKSVEWFAFAVSLDYIILAFLYAFIYNRHKVQRLGFSKDIAKRLLTSCTPFILANIMVFVYSQFDRVMIKHLLDSTSEVGLYSTAMNICTMISFIPVAILDSSRPFIAQAKLEDQKKYQVRFSQLVCAIMWISFAYSAFVTVFAKLIIQIMYGEAYMGAVTCLRIAVWFSAFSYLGSAKNFWLICEDKKKYVFAFSAMGAVANVALNFMFIPLWGINGAAVATLLTQILTNFIFPLLLKETRKYSKCVVNAFLFKNVDLSDILKIIKRR